MHFGSQDEWLKWDFGTGTSTRKTYNLFTMQENLHLPHNDVGSRQENVVSHIKMLIPDKRTFVSHTKMSVPDKMTLSPT